MKTELQSISKIFTERLFRIPDYQRGYSWTLKQLKEFWNDLTQLEISHNHYVGVLTLEDVPESIHSTWSEDTWIIKSKSYTPYYIVDGQQRLTTSIILIQCIQELISENEKINYTSKEEIRNKYIFQTKDGGISRSYLFGYEKDNPSYEYLKTKIFQEYSDNSATPQETIYTSNLDAARMFFLEQLKSIKTEDVEVTYKKITQNFLFNIYAISEDVDTYVAFETMNNRGKPLSHLELLKNRLIYLSTRFEDSTDEKSKLRAAINEAWKSVYHFLGKNKENPLDDDLFLQSHFLIYFTGVFNEFDYDYIPYEFTKKRRLSGYQEYLLDVYFSPKAIPSKTNKEKKSHNLSVKNVYSYVSHLKKAVENWYCILNPEESHFGEETKFWLEKINRIGIEPIAPLILIFLQNEKREKKIIIFLTSLEKFMFTFSLLNRYGSWAALHHSWFREEIRDFLEKRSTLEEITNKINERHEEFKKDPLFMSKIIDDFRISGFYSWRELKYFLYEYEISLKESSKSHRNKLNWKVLAENLRDHYTVEHIYPQNTKKHHWTSKFREFQTNERSSIKQSLGNLLPLSKPKNCSIQDKPFMEKKGLPGSTIGFRYGSYSEIEVSEYENWTAHEILERGIKLLDFMEKRWGIIIGSKKEKIRMLGLKSVSEKLSRTTPKPAMSIK